MSKVDDYRVHCHPVPRPSNRPITHVPSGQDPPRGNERAAAVAMPLDAPQGPHVEQREPGLQGRERERSVDVESLSVIRFYIGVAKSIDGHSFRLDRHRRRRGDLNQFAPNPPAAAAAPPPMSDFKINHSARTQRRGKTRPRTREDTVPLGRREGCVNSTWSLIEAPKIIKTASAGTVFHFPSL